MVEKSEVITLVEESREAISIIQKEICKIEYLTRTRLPQVEYLEGEVFEHARVLAAGLAALARCRLTEKGRETVSVQ